MPAGGKPSEPGDGLVGVVGPHASSALTRDLGEAPGWFVAAAPGIAAQVSAARLMARALLWLGRYQLHARLYGSSAARAREQLARWSRRAWSDLRLEVRVSGIRPQGPRIYIANHRSYLDILVLSGTLGGTFLARADVAQWPLMGMVAKRIEAVFVDRDDPYARATAARRMMRHTGHHSLVVFPEGTTTGNRLPADFHPGLFRMLFRLRAQLVPVTIRYSDRRAYWTEEMGLAQHLRTRVLTGPRLVSAVHIGTGLDACDYADAGSLARATHRAICRPIEGFGELA